MIHIVSVAAFTRSICAFLAVTNILTAVALSVDSTILIIASHDADAKMASMGLDGYGIPYRKLLVPSNGIEMPILNSSATEGNFGGIIVISNVAYDKGGLYISAITDQQWSQIHSYQSAFKVRMARINEYPGSQFGTYPATSGSDTGCCADTVEQKISLKSTDLFPGANLKANAGLSTKGLWHYPAIITDRNTTVAFATFAPAGVFTSETTAAVVHSIDGREQMVWFMSWDLEWSQTANFLQHSYIHWMTRTLFAGKRKTHLSTQVDDVHLDTELYQPKGSTFKIRTGDLDAHVSWQKRINGRLPAGSDFWLEMGHNGNGNIVDAAGTRNGEVSCKPAYAVDYTSPPNTPMEFMKPPGTGTDLWPTEFENYTWSESCSKIDPFLMWFQNKENLNAFAHLSHTFTHEELNNATYHDAAREIFFNQAWMKAVGIDQAQRFSPKGLIPPAITGLHNADALKGWTDNGILYVVGDNTRPVLRNQKSKYWPLPSTVESNGREGIIIIPRFATTIFYNCDKPDCTVQEWHDTSAGEGDFNALLDNARAVNVRNLLSLQADPYMFHQANMRQTDVDSLTIGPESGKISLITAWVETITQEMYRLTDWPIVSLKHDDIAKYFIDRMTLDGCQPKLTYNYAADGGSITSVTVGANGNTCSVPVPVTIPDGTVTSDGGSQTLDKVGSEPPISWVTLSGGAITLHLGTPVKL